MSDYAITVKHQEGQSYEIGNGLAILHTAWYPEQGKFLATELFLASLGSCMLATLIDYARTLELDVEGSSVKVEAESATKPHRMSKIHVTYYLPKELTDAKKALLVRAGNRCKVHATIEHSPEFEITVEDSLI